MIDHDEAARPATAVCDNCGGPVSFDDENSGTVTLSFGATVRTTTLCASCSLDAEKEERWRTTGVWVGPDPPPSIRNARKLTDDEARELFGRAATPDDPDPPT